MGYSPWGGKELDTTERLTHMHTQALRKLCVTKGEYPRKGRPRKGSPLQGSPWEM